MREVVDADSASLPTASTGVVMQPNKSESWYTVAAENVRPKARREGMRTGHTRVNKNLDDGEVEVYGKSAAPKTSEERKQEPR